MPISKERLAEIKAMPDDQIDTSDIPELDETFFETARLVLPAGTKKKTVTMRMDEDVLEWFPLMRQRPFDPHERGIARIHVGASRPRSR